MASARRLTLLALFAAYEVQSGRAEELTRCAGSGCQPRLQLHRERPLPARLQRSITADHIAKLEKKLQPTSPSLLQTLKVPIAFTGWYLLSIVYSLMNKEVLTVWKFPCIFSAMQLLVGAIWISGLWLPLPTFGLREQRFAPLRAPPRLTFAEVKKVAIVATWLALGHVLSTVAPAYGTVAFTNVVKTLEPLFTCLFSFLLLGQRFSLPVYLSLLPVIGGVAVASANEVAFSSISLVSGLASNVAFALRAISAKKIMSQPIGQNMHAQNLYGVLTLLALAMITPFALLAEGGSIWSGTAETIRVVGLNRFLRMLLYAGMSHYLYNECAFLALSSVHPVTHAVANTIKRVAVIVVSVLYFHNPLTLTGAAGSAVATFGVFLYSLAKAHS